MEMEYNLENLGETFQVVSVRLPKKKKKKKKNRY